MAGIPEYERHTLLHLRFDARERVFAELVAQGHERRILGEMLLPELFPNAFGLHVPVPGIVRREENAPREDMIPVGFSSWERSANGRLRAASFVRPDEIATASTPEAVLAKLDVRGQAALPSALAALAALRENWPTPPETARLGVWGSAALELETGYPYIDNRSDLDVRIAPCVPLSGDSLRAWLDGIMEMEERFAVRIDAEVSLPSGYGVSLKELLRPGVTVLGKGLLGVTLLRKTEVFAGPAVFAVPG